MSCMLHFKTFIVLFLRKHPVYLGVASHTIYVPPIPPPLNQDYKHAPSCWVYSVLGIKPRASCILQTKLDSQHSY